MLFQAIMAGNMKNVIWRLVALASILAAGACRGRSLREASPVFEKFALARVIEENKRYLEPTAWGAGSGSGAGGVFRQSEHHSSRLRVRPGYREPFWDGLRASVKKHIADQGGRETSGGNSSQDDIRGASFSYTCLKQEGVIRVWVTGTDDDVHVAALVTEAARGPAPRSTPPADASSRPALEQRIETLREELSRTEELFLAAPEGDRARLADWLRQPDTGLVRLLPRERYDGRLLVRGGGAYYSFVRASHDYNAVPQLSLEQGQLKTGFAGLDFGLIAALGDVPLASLSVSSEGVRPLTAVVPPTRRTEARERYHEPLSLEGRRYQRSVPCTADTTYVLRAISYGRADALVVFRVLRQEPDDSIVLQWRKLRDFETPQLAD